MVERGWSCWNDSTFDAYVPLVAAFPAAFFIACGRPNLERSPVLLLTVLLLLTEEHQEEVGGVKNERDGTSEMWAPRGSFFVSEVVEKSSSAWLLFSLWYDLVLHGFYTP